MKVVGIRTLEDLITARNQLRAPSGALIVELEDGRPCDDCGHRISRGERGRFRWEGDAIRITHELGCK